MPLSFVSFVKKWPINPSAQSNSVFADHCTPLRVSESEMFIATYPLVDLFGGMRFPLQVIS